MNLERLIAVTGKSGVYRMTGNRPTGLVLEDLDTGRKFFVSGRLQEFTPLDSVSIYTLNEQNQDDTVELKVVFAAMHEYAKEHPLPSASNSSDALRNYFLEVLPQHNREKVKVSDIKKIIKWFLFLEKRNFLSPAAE